VGTDADGGIQLWIGGAQRPGNWLASAPNAEFLLVRQLFNDWEHEAPGDFFIEREEAHWPAPPPRTDWMAGRLRKLACWLEKGGTLWENMSRGFLSMEPNTLRVHMPEAAGERAGASGQAYGMGNFQCGRDEAVIVEFRPPRCHHWGVSLANWYWECIEYASRQCSLNGAQASLDGDGVFRAVIAHEDPGVPNWLDPAGNQRGTIIVRFVHADAVPEVRFRRVPLEGIRSALPRATPRVDPATRAAILQRRRHAVIRRYRR
jgi:hypothetical protein